MNCPMCNLVVAKIPEQLSGPHCKCSTDAHVGLLLEYAETLEFHEDKLRDTLRMLDLRDHMNAELRRLRAKVAQLEAVIETNHAALRAYHSSNRYGTNAAGKDALVDILCDLFDKQKAGSWRLRRVAQS